MLNKLFINTVLQVVMFTFLVTGTSLAEEIAPLTHNLTKLKKSIIAPNLRLQNMDEEIIDIKDLKGKVVVVNFWATWCPPCRREMASLERLYQATKNKNVELLAVNVGEDVDTVFPFMGNVTPSPNFPILFDTDGKAMKQWKVRGLPTTYIVSPTGMIVYRAVGGREFDHKNIQQAVINLGQ